MSGEGEHPLSGKLNLCKSRKANSTPRLAWRHGIGIPPVACGRCAGGGGKRAASGKLLLPLSSAVEGWQVSLRMLHTLRGMASGARLPAHPHKCQKLK